MSDNIFQPDFEHLLDSLKVMTIATPWENGVWSAPVYYIYKHGAFWFFSSPDSRHIMGAKISSDMTVSRKITPCSDIAVSAEIITSSEIMVAASIFMDDSKFSNIKGVQMRGKIEEISKIDNMGEVISLASAYIKKFGIPFNESGGAKDKIDALAFIRQHYRSQLYRFIPSEMIYMDNSIHIGFKQKIELT